MCQGRPVRLGAKINIEVVVDAEPAFLIVNMDLRSHGPSACRLRTLAKHSTGLQAGIRCAGD